MTPKQLQSPLKTWSKFEDRTEDIDDESEIVKKQECTVCLFRDSAALILVD